MQDRYTGDIGDYGKYGLLRVLGTGRGGRRLRLGVNWYLIPNQGHPGDGMFTGYLRDDLPRGNRGPGSTLKKCDPQLFSLLQRIVFPKGAVPKSAHETNAEMNRCSFHKCPAGRENLEKCSPGRCVGKVEKLGILPDDTLFYSAVLACSRRDSWVKEGYDLLRGCDLVFFDPDNGLQVKSARRKGKTGLKYVFHDEAGIYYNRGQSLIIYQHRSMEPENIYLERIRNSIASITGRENTGAIRLRYRRGSARDLLVIPNHRHPNHGDLLKAGIDAMLQTAWGDHFIKYYL